jgi:hypothetical protein
MLAVEMSFKYSISTCDDLLEEMYCPEHPRELAQAVHRILWENVDTYIEITRMPSPNLYLSPHHKKDAAQLLMHQLQTAYPHAAIVAIVSPTLIGSNVRPGLGEFDEVMTSVCGFFQQWKFKKVDLLPNLQNAYSYIWDNGKVGKVLSYSDTKAFL